MPWRECDPMDERLKFIARLLDGEKMAGLCRQFGISRKTGYKILTRYNEIGLERRKPMRSRCSRPHSRSSACPRRSAPTTAFPSDRKDRLQDPHPLQRDRPGAKEAYAFQVFEAAFKEFGLPKAIRTDNGVPFASPN